MATKDTLNALGDDPFDFIGRTARRDVEPTVGPDDEPGGALEPEPEPTKQISARLPVSLYKRLKIHLMDADENQEAMLVRLIAAELDRTGA